jgi:hypothetical protein
LTTLVYKVWGKTNFNKVCGIGCSVDPTIPPHPKIWRHDGQDINTVSQPQIQFFKNTFLKTTPHKNFKKIYKVQCPTFDMPNKKEPRGLAGAQGGFPQGEATEQKICTIAEKKCTLTATRQQVRRQH